MRAPVRFDVRKALEMRAELSSKRPNFLVDTGWFLGYLGQVQLVYMDGRIDDASFHRYLEALAQDIDGRATRDEAVAILYHVPQPAALTSKRRSLLANVLREREAAVRKNTIAYALATTSALVRGGVKVLFWLAPPPYPNAVVATPEAGFDFLARYATDLDTERLAVRYAEIVHEFAAMQGQP